MINIDNLKVPTEPYYVKGLLCGDGILANDLLDQLLAFDFTQGVEYAGHTNRRMYSIGSDYPQSIITTPIDHLLYDLACSLTDLVVFEQLSNTALAADDMNIGMFWPNGIQGVAKHFSRVKCTLIEDLQGYTLQPHIDNRLLCGNLQIYLHDDPINTGTVMCDQFGSGRTKALPFRTNYGYFLFTSEYGWHSVEQVKSSRRRSLIISWEL